MLDMMLRSHGIRLARGPPTVSSFVFELGRMAGFGKPWQGCARLQNGDALPQGQEGIDAAIWVMRALTEQAAAKLEASQLSQNDEPAASTPRQTGSMSRQNFVVPWTNASKRIKRAPQVESMIAARRSVAEAAAGSDRSNRLSSLSTS